MTSKQFIDALNKPANMYSFVSLGYAGYVAKAEKEKFVIIIYDREKQKQEGSDAEPTAISQYTSPNELLEQFTVDGHSFAETILPFITELTIVTA